LCDFFLALFGINKYYLHSGFLADTIYFSFHDYLLSNIEIVANDNTYLDKNQGCF